MQQWDITVASFIKARWYVCIVSVWSVLLLFELTGCHPLFITAVIVSPISTILHPHIIQELIMP